MIEDSGFSRDAQRLMDGEPHGEVAPAERAQAELLARAGDALRDRLVVPGPEVDEAVMAAVRSRPRPRRSVWAWAVEPRTVRLRPIWVPLAAAALLALWLTPRRGGAPSAPPVAAVQARDTVYVRFELVAPEARQVHLAGDFNGWQPDAVALARDASGHWTVTLPLVVGEHRYQFVVDGARWVPDPGTEVVDDGFGGRNSVVVVGPRGVVRS